MKKIGLYYFTNDLRFNHNELLSLACDQVDELIGVVMPIQTSPFVQHHSGEDLVGGQRLLFWQQSIKDLAKQFEAQNQSLFTIQSSEANDLIQLIETCQVSHIYCNQHPGSDEYELIREVQDSLPHIKVISTNNSTLLNKAELPFELNKLPTSFTRFRKLIEANRELLNITEHSPAPVLPKMPIVLRDYDVASNWGNWSYIAGMNGQQTRHFDLEKQTQMYDPQHEFIQRWATTNELHQIAK